MQEAERADELGGLDGPRAGPSSCTSATDAP